ncbi:MAG: GNAT family N-acetyltransferase [Clostridia bacterium]
MIWVRLAKDNDLEYVKELIRDNDCKRFSELDKILVGEIDGQIISTASLKIIENIGLMHTLFVKENFRNQHIGDMTARAIINLADNKDLETLYYLCDNLEFSYFLSKMHYVPVKLNEVEKHFSDYVFSDKYAFKLDLKEFFKHSCTCDN